MKRLIAIVVIATVLMLVATNARLTPGDMAIAVGLGVGIIGTLFVGGK